MADKKEEHFVYTPDDEDKKKYDQQLKDQEGLPDPDYQDHDNSNTGPINPTTGGKKKASKKKKATKKKKASKKKKTAKKKKATKKKKAAKKKKATKKKKAAKKK